MSSQNSSDNLKNFYGQETIKNRLKTLFSIYEKSRKFPSSIFIFGPHGSGKSTLAKIIGKKLNRQMVYLTDIKSAESFAGDLISQKQNIIVLDNLDQFSQNDLKLVYPVVKQKFFNVNFANGKNIKVDLTNRLIIGLSSRAGIVPKIIRESFAEIWHLENYKVFDIRKIILAAAKKQKINLQKDAALELAHTSRKSPQRALSILNKIIDQAKLDKVKSIDFNFVQKELKSYKIDRLGLEQFDRDILTIIIEKFSGGPVGIENYAAKLSESPWNIEEIFEPYLIGIGFLKRTSHGRVATRAAHEFLGYQYSVGKKTEPVNHPKISSKQKKMF